MYQKELIFVCEQNVALRKLTNNTIAYEGFWFENCSPSLKNDVNLWYISIYFKFNSFFQCPGKDILFFFRYEPEHPGSSIIKIECDSFQLSTKQRLGPELLFV